MTTIKKLSASFLVLVSLGYTAQNNKTRESLTVLNIDARSVNTEPNVMGNMVRIELEKLDTFDVMDRYDVAYLIEKNKLSIANCYGKTCLSEIGSTINSDKMFSGTIEVLGKTIMVSYRLINVKQKKIEKTYVHEFLYLPEEIQNIVKVSVLEMFGRKYEKGLMEKLSKHFDFDNSINNPNKDRLRLDGPRMGAVSFWGPAQERLKESKQTGGFEAYPIMWQFGYQFEKQYLNSGKYQALFEFVPMITGLDQGYFIPSSSLLLGFRSNTNGWEFAIGPNFNLLPESNGYFDDAKQWKRESDWDNTKGKNPYTIVKRLDSRGVYYLHSNVIFAVGRTIKSGKLNIPINIYVIPGTQGWRAGVSFGFNGKNK